MTSEWLVALTALFAVVLGPLSALLVARWQGHVSLRIARDQIRSSIATTTRNTSVSLLRASVAELQAAVAQLPTVSPAEQAKKFERCTELFWSARTLLNLEVSDEKALAEDLWQLIDRTSNPVGVTEPSEVRLLQKRISETVSRIIQKEVDDIRSIERKELTTRRLVSQGVWLATLISLGVLAACLTTWLLLRPTAAGQWFSASRDDSGVVFEFTVRRDKDGRLDGAAATSLPGVSRLLTVTGASEGRYVALIFTDSTGPALIYQGLIAHDSMAGRLMSRAGNPRTLTFHRR